MSRVFTERCLACKQDLHATTVWPWVAWGGGEQEHRRRGEGEGGEVGRGREDEVWAEDQRAQLGTVSRAGGAHRVVL